MARKILLPDRTNIYSTISFLNDNAGSSSAHVFGRKFGLSMMLCRYNADKPSYIGGVVNYLRLSVTVGKPVRMFL